MFLRYVNLQITITTYNILGQSQRLQRVCNERAQAQLQCVANGRPCSDLNDSAPVKALCSIQNYFEHKQTR